LIDAKSAGQRVLIRRLPGLEESSRYWSVWMTLDHLRIVHVSMREAIRALTNGVMPAGTASTAAVKPNPNVAGAVVAEYEKSCDELLATVATARNLKTALRFAHPWLGPLDAAGWHALAAGHIQFDPESHYIRRWVKETVPPILDHTIARERALTALKRNRP
jgi:hypothetical protein